MIKNTILGILRLAETAASRAQGKGYGSSTIKQENKLLHQLLAKPPRLAIDIGGNVGNYTAEIRRRNPSIEIHTFEPSSKNIGILTNRFSSDPLIKIIPHAVSDSAGVFTLYSDTPGSGGSSLTQRKLDHFNIRFDVQESVNTIRFEDYWIEQLNRRDLDIVKMDIEGHELAALKGFGQAIHATRVLQFEFGGCNIDTRTFFQDFWYFFKEHGFELHRISPLGLDRITTYRESDEFFITTNYIAVNRRQAA
jgi:FkbM family methyltransferase